MSLFSCFFRQQKIIERKEEDLEKECTICMDDITKDDFVTKCHHRFHKKCLNEWISQYSNTECPICRKELGLYVFETKRQRKQRLRKEEHMKKIEEEERELNELARRLEEQHQLQLERERLETLRNEYYKKNRKRRKQFEQVLEVFLIRPTRSVNLRRIDFMNCVNIKNFVKEITTGEGEISGRCRFCKTNTYQSYQISNRRIFHKECYKIFNCYHNHNH